MYNDIIPCFPPLVYDVNFTGDAVVKIAKKSGVRRGSDFGDLFRNAASTSSHGSSRSPSAKGAARLYKLCVCVYIQI